MARTVAIEKLYGFSFCGQKVFIDGGYLNCYAPQG